MKLLALFCLTVGLAGVSLSAGRSWLPPAALFEALMNPEGAGRMIWQLRLPRLLVGLVAGASFGLAGLVFQTLLKNPLASPDVIGVTQCAAFGGMVAMVMGIPLMVGAWTGGVSAVVILAWLSAHPRLGFDPRALVLQGLALAIFAGAATEALILRMSDNGSGMALTWLSGTLNGVAWPEVSQAVWLLPMMLPLLAAGRTLDRLELGDDLARALGLPVRSLRVGLGLVAALVAAGAVSLCGPMGFVALAAGPIGRLLARGRPSPLAAMVTGAAFVTVADILTRTIAPVALLPTGLYTSLIGAPVLILAVRRMARS